MMKYSKNPIENTVVLNKNDSEEFLDFNSDYEFQQVMKILNEIAKEEQ